MIDILKDYVVKEIGEVKDLVKSVTTSASKDINQCKCITEDKLKSLLKTSDDKLNAIYVELQKLNKEK